MESSSHKLMCFSCTQIGEFLATCSKKGLSYMQKLSKQIAAHESAWQELHAADRAHALLALLNQPT